MNRNVRFLASLVLFAALLSASSTSAQKGGGRVGGTRVGVGPTPGRGNQSVQAPQRTVAAVGKRPQVQQHYQATDLVAGLKQHMPGEPVKVLASIQMHHAANLLSDRDERILVNRAVRSLAAQVRPDPTLDEALEHLAEVYHARDCVAAIDVKLERPLLTLEADARDRALGIGLRRVTALARDGKSAEARTEAEKLFDHLANATDFRSRNRPEGRAELLKSLDTLGYEGFGYTHAEADGQFVITYTHADGPAYDAGLRPGDVIVAVNGRQLQQMISSEVNDLLKARDATRTFTVVRDGEPEREVRVTRGRVLGDSVDTLRELGRFLQTVEAVAHAEKTTDALAGKDSIAAIKAVRVALLPEQLRPRVRQLLAAIALTEAVGGPPGDRPNVAELKQQIALFHKASGDEALAGRVQQEVAVRAMLNGHVTEARQLMPERGSPKHAGRLLADMKSLITGTGDVKTDAGKSTLESHSGAGRGNGPPPGIRAMLPDDPGDDWRPRVKASGDADQSPLKEVREYEKKWLAEVRDEFAAQRGAGRRQIDLAAQALEVILQRQRLRAATVAAFQRQVALRIKRPLTPLELVLARERALRGEDPAVVADIFQKEKPDPLDLGPDLARIGLALPPCQLVPSIAAFACTYAVLEVELPRAVRVQPGKPRGK